MLYPPSLSGTPFFLTHSSVLPDLIILFEETRFFSNAFTATALSAFILAIN
jgi:hypothetical protein